MIEYKYIKVGDIICTPIDQVYNASIGATSGVKLNVKVPAGVVYSSSNLSKGNYNAIENYWQINTLKKNESVQGSICWLVYDDCLAPFDFEFTISTEAGKACINDNLSKLCLTIDGLTNCETNLYKPVKWIYNDYDLGLHDQTIIAYANNSSIDITLPKASDVFLSAKSAGSDWDVTVLDLTNPVRLVAPEGVKIIDKSSIDDATNIFDFTLIGQTVFIQSIGTHYLVKYAV